MLDFKTLLLMAFSTCHTVHLSSNFQPSLTKLPEKDATLSHTVCCDGGVLFKHLVYAKFGMPVESNVWSIFNIISCTLIIGRPKHRDCDEKEKTIMLVGATGSGKSTLVDGIVNYVMGVSFEDPFRFTMVTLEDEEKKNDANQVNLFESRF